MKMTIDRYNYESYFLLYVDDELTADEHIAVEKFIKENIDLKIELEILMETALPLEEIVFTNKDSLLRNESMEYLLQEKMLLLLDNELEPDLIPSLEAAINSNKPLQQEWNTLQKVKLDADEKIIFEDKSLLYRNEKYRVVSMRFWRLAAAAVIMGVGTFAGISFFTKDDHLPDVAISRTQPGSAEKQADRGKGKISPNDDNNSPEPITANAVPSKEKNNGHIKLTTVTPNPAEEKNISEQNAYHHNTAFNKIADQSLIASEKINGQESNKIISSTVKDNIAVLQNKKEPVTIAEKNKAINIINNTSASLTDQEITDNSYAKNVASLESESVSNDNRLLFMDEEKINHSKIGGLFKKVKRVIARNANIKSGNSIKIAGFEIAAR